MFERFTRAARDTVVSAQTTARRLDHPVVGTVHLLVALTEREESLRSLLGEHGITGQTVQRELTALLDTAPSDQASPEAVATDDAAALAAIGIDLTRIREAVESRFGPGALDEAAGQVPPTRRRGLSLLRRSRAGTGETELLRADGGSRPGARPGRHVPFTPAARKALELSLREALRLGDREIGADHLLLGLLRTGEGTAAAVLQRLGVEAVPLRQALEGRRRRAG